MSLDQFVVSFYGNAETGLRPKPNSAAMNARKVDLRYTLNIEGFYESAEISFPSLLGGLSVGEAQRLMDVSFRDHVEIRVGELLVWEGRVARIGYGEGWVPDRITCVGYKDALNDYWIDETSATAITSGNALKLAIINYAPSLRLGNGDQFQPPNVNHAGGLREFYKMTPAELANLIVTEGDTTGVTIDVQVRDGRIVWIRRRLYPETATYSIPFDRHRVSWDEDSAGMAQTIQVETSADAAAHEGGVFVWLAAEASTSLFRDTWGFGGKIVLRTGDQEAEAAAAYRDTELTRRAEPLVQATINVTSDPATWITRHRAGAWPWYAVQPDGSTVTVGGKSQQHIIGVTVDAAGGVATYELGSLDPSMPKNQLRDVRKQSFLTRQYLDSNSGTKTRG